MANRIVSLLVCISIGLFAGCDREQQQEPERPNIIYIYADDLGYGELGVYGQEKIETPNIDELARGGMIFTQHYTGTPVCAPARYNLLTGKHSGNSYIRANSNRPTPEGFSFDNFENRYEAFFEHPEIEGQRAIPAETITVGDVLQQAGYRTAAIGKWGNGGPWTEGHPNRQGFDYFYGYLDQRMAHTYYPTHLWENEERIILDNELVDPHQDLPEDADPYDPASYAKFHDQPDYSAELMHVEALRFIEENYNNPFFLYLPTPIPHVALQAPQRWIDYYREKFGDEEPYITGTYVPVRYPNATYAAMISYLDEQVGEIVDKLKELGIYDNTLIMFSSDNGPTTAGGVDPEYFDSAAPFQNLSGRVKGHLYEGGIRMPMIATWANRIEPGSNTDHLSAQWDVLPTLAEAAGVTPPEGIDGISFLPVLLGNEGDQECHDYLYFEFPQRGYGGQQAVRMGKWKGIRTEIISEGNLEIELYNLEEDIRELHNVAGENPDIVREMERIMEIEHTEPELEIFRMQALYDK